MSLNAFLRLTSLKLDVSWQLLLCFWSYLFLFFFFFFSFKACNVSWVDMNYIHQSTSLAARWTVGSAMQPVWFPTCCWLQAHPSCRLGGFVLCLGCLWQPTQTAQTRRGSAWPGAQSLGWHRSLLWPSGFAGEVRMKPRRESGFRTPV